MSAASPAGELAQRIAELSAEELFTIARGAQQSGYPMMQWPSALREALAEVLAGPVERVAPAAVRAFLGTLRVGAASGSEALCVAANVLADAASALLRSAGYEEGEDLLPVWQNLLDATVRVRAVLASERTSDTL